MSGGWNNGPVREVGEFGTRVWECILRPFIWLMIFGLFVGSLVDYFVFHQR